VRAGGSIDTLACVLPVWQVVDWTQSPYNLEPLQLGSGKTWLAQMKEERGDDAVSARLLDYSMFLVTELYLEQRFAYELIQHRITPTLEAVRYGLPRPYVEPVVIDGFGGTGKSYLIHCVCKEFARRAAELAMACFHKVAAYGGVLPACADA